MSLDERISENGGQRSTVAARRRRCHPKREPADQVAANTALLERYFADVNTHNVAALKDVISDHYVQHGPNAPVFPSTGKKLACEGISI